LVLSFPNGAGTCDVSQMQSQGHGSPSTSGVGGFSVSVKNATTAGSYVISINGPSSIEGVLIYTQDSKGNRIGNFVVPSNLQSKSCGGSGTNSLTHTDQNSKSMPLKLTWSPMSNGTITVKSLVVVNSYANWHQLNDVNFEAVSSGSVISSSNNGSGDNSDSGNTGGGDGSGSSFFQQYSLFIVVIVITAALYVIGSLVESALRRQQVKARAFAKAVGGFNQ
ncbi:10305_t:CDS:1, partial [Acaulospora colombiana]